MLGSIECILSTYLLVILGKLESWIRDDSDLLTQLTIEILRR